MNLLRINFYPQVLIHKSKAKGFALVKGEIGEADKYCHVATWWLPLASYRMTLAGCAGPPHLVMAVQQCTYITKGAKTFFKN